jgi:hypothetical protein
MMNLTGKRRRRKRGKIKAQMRMVSDPSFPPLTFPFFKRFFFVIKLKYCPDMTCFLLTGHFKVGPYCNCGDLRHRHVSLLISVQVELTFDIGILCPPDIIHVSAAGETSSLTSDSESSKTRHRHCLLRHKLSLDDGNPSDQKTVEENGKEQKVKKSRRTEGVCVMGSVERLYDWIPSVP